MFELLSIALVLLFEILFKFKFCKPLILLILFDKEEIWDDFWTLFVLLFDEAISGVDFIGCICFPVELI